MSSSEDEGGCRAKLTLKTRQRAWCCIVLTPREDSRGVDECEVRERLGKVPEHTVMLDVVLLREQPDIVDHARGAVEERERASPDRFTGLSITSASGPAMARNRPSTRSIIGEIVP